MKQMVVGLLVVVGVFTIRSVVRRPPRVADRPHRRRPAEREASSAAVDEGPRRAR